MYLGLTGVGYCILTYSHFCKLISLYAVPLAMEEPGSSSVGARSQGDFQAMTQFFKRAMGFQGIPPGRLPKFHGNAERPCERSLREWLEDFEQIVAKRKPE